MENMEIKMENETKNDENEKKVVMELGTGELRRVEIPVELINEKHTDIVVRPVTQVIETEFKGKKYLWMNGSSYCKHTIKRLEGDKAKLIIETQAPVLYVKYASGTRRQTLFSVEGLYDTINNKFIVTKRDEQELFEAKKKYTQMGYTIASSMPLRNVFAAYIYFNFSSSSAEKREEEKEKEQEEKIVEEFLRLAKMLGKEKALELIKNL